MLAGFGMVHGTWGMCKLQTKFSNPSPAPAATRDWGTRLARGSVEWKGHSLPDDGRPGPAWHKRDREGCRAKCGHGACKRAGDWLPELASIFRETNVNDTFRTVVQAFQVMVEGYQLLAARLSREFDQLQNANADLKAYVQQLEANAQQLAAHVQHLSASVAGLTEREEALHAEKEALAQQVVQKNDILDLLAREVRPPLTALKGALTLLREEPIDPEDRRAFLTLANENVRELLHLIDRCLPLPH